MNAHDVKILYEEVIFYDIFKKFNDGTETYLGTTHIPDLAIAFCEKYQDCYVKRNHSITKIAELEEQYLW